MAHMASTVKTLMSRASTLSSDGVERVAEEKRIADALNFIQRILGNRTSRTMRMTRGPPRTSLILPYIGSLSKTIRRILVPLDIKVAFRPNSTLTHQLVHPKDPVPMDKHTGVVYQIPCSECLQEYVRQSGRTLKHLLTEHQRALRNGDVEHLL